MLGDGGLILLVFCTVTSEWLEVSRECNLLLLAFLSSELRFCDNSNVRLVAVQGVLCVCGRAKAYPARGFGAAHLPLERPVFIGLQA